MKYQLACADILGWADAYRGSLFHALITDPPYHLTSITDRFGKEGSAPAQYGKDGVFARTSRGFMNQEWDGGDIAFQSDTWKKIGKLLLPGAFCVTFASSRGWHRVAVAIEDAGFILHPTIFGWTFGQGFPKATNVNVKAQARRGLKQGQFGKAISNDAMLNLSLEDRLYWRKVEETFEGYAYGGQVLKPGLEPILVWQKPYQNDPLTDISGTGAGVLNVNETRLAVNPSVDDPWLGGKGEWRSDRAGYQGGFRGDKIGSSSLGRWPSNFVIEHHPDCRRVGMQTVKGSRVEKPSEPDIKGREWGTIQKHRGPRGIGDKKGREVVAVWECHPDCPARRLNEQVGLLKSGDPIGVKKAKNNVYGEYGTGIDISGFGDSGGASRFFFEYQYSHLEEAEPAKYVGKASTAEREAGLSKRKKKVVNDGREKPIDNPYQRGETERLNVHPTVKPIQLTRWLATLLLPPDAYSPRRILVPFAGVGSEMVGCLLAGWDQVVGVELGEEYVTIAEDRIRYWLNNLPENETGERHGPHQQPLF